MVKPREAIEAVLSMYCRSCNSRNRNELSIIVYNAPARNVIATIPK